MKKNKWMLIVAFGMLFGLYACNTSEKSETSSTTDEEQSELLAGNDRNEKGELIDANGHLIMGCPGHKDMVGSEGDICPKCGSMKLIPITWDISGIDTVRVTTLPDYQVPEE